MADISGRTRGGTLAEYKINGGGGLTLQVEEWGNLEGQPILFLHGWSQSHLCWHKQYKDQKLQRYRMVAFDLRGHGGSETPTGDAFYNDYSLWADDVHSVIDELALIKPVLVGWSYGGIVITDYVKKYGDENLGGVNFVCAATNLTEPAMGTFLGPGILDHFEAATSEDESIHASAIEKFLRGCFYKPISESDFQGALSYNREVRPDVRLALVSRDIDNSPVLRQMSCPILISQGREDTIVLPAMAEVISSNSKNASLSWFNGVGHAPFVEDVERFNKELETFVDSL